MIVYIQRINGRVLFLATYLITIRFINSVSYPSYLKRKYHIWQHLFLLLLKAFIQLENIRFDFLPFNVGVPQASILG